MKNYPCLIIDGKGDIGNGSILDIAKRFCNEYDKKLYVINMTDISNSYAYNPLKNTSVTIGKDMLINMTNWSEEHYKANMERYLQMLIDLMKKNNIPINLPNIINYMDSETLIELSAQVFEQELISKEEHTRNVSFIDKSSNIAMGACARFATIAEGDMASIFLADGIDIFTALKENAIILFVLNPLLYPETSTAMGRLALIDAKQAVSKLFLNQKRTFFIFDEINVYSSTVLLDLVNKSRSANITCFLSTQSLSDLEVISESFKNQIIENCNNYLVMRQNTFSSAEEWAKIFGTTEKIQMTYQMDELETTGKGSARAVHAFKVHPDSIKNQKLGECYFLSKDTAELEHLRVNKPF